MKVGYLAHIFEVILFLRCRGEIAQKMGSMLSSERSRFDYAIRRGDEKTAIKLYTGGLEIDCKRATERERERESLRGNQE